MNNTIRQLLAQINALEDELRTALHEQESRLSYEVNGKRVEFERAIRDAHSRLKVGIVRWIIADRPQNLICAPFIYGMIIPLAFFDLCITIYQAVCFPIFRICTQGARFPRALCALPGLWRGSRLSRQVGGVPQRA